MISKMLKDSIINDNYKLLDKFLRSNKVGGVSFRYFQKRPFNIINNHLFTCLYFEKNKCVGYGHLDYENEKTWLGIIVADGMLGKGYGTYIIKDLISNTKNDIHLSVDKNNVRAINLYSKIGFVNLFTNEDYSIMIYRQKN